MAQEVASQFTTAQLETYGNVILNGYLSVIPNTINKKAWQYQETTTAPVNLPSLIEIQPALKGWTTNYGGYYTNLPPNAYSQEPGNPTTFEYNVASYNATNYSLWAQAPERFSNNTVSSVTPPQYVNNPNVIAYSFISPRSNRVEAPPIGNLTPGLPPPPPPPPAIPTYTLSSTPVAQTNGTVITSTVTTANVPNGTILYWEYSGVGVTGALFTSGILTGQVTITSGNANFAQTSVSVISGGPYTVNIKVYSDAARTTQVGATSTFVLNPNVVTTTPELGSYIDLWQYRNTDATFPYTSNSGLNPVVRASNIKDNCLPLLDRFYILTETQIYSDGKLYMGVNPGVPAALVLDSSGTTWAPNTGSANGTYVSPTNPDYVYSAWPIKNTDAYMNSEGVDKSNYMLSIGGYLLSQYMDQAGSTVSLAQTAANQIVNFINITGAAGVDLDYEPVGQVCNPANMVTLMREVYNAVKAANPGYEVHLTLIPSLVQSDPDQKIATAVACENYYDQLNVMTYDDPNSLDQPPYEPGSVTVYNHTGVARSVQSVQWFIDAGVPNSKLGMGIAQYGRIANPPAGAFTNSGAPYSQIVAGADAAGETSNQFPLGRWFGTSKIQAGSPTSQANYYDSPTQALWGFDSVDTIMDKVQSASNMGLRAVFSWQISNDYCDETAPPAAPDARANFALLAAARYAITNL
jgi:hypothetical protein